MRRLSGLWNADNRLPGVLTPMGAGIGVAGRVGAPQCVGLVAAAAVLRYPVLRGK
jgi:hypothetical protein